MTIYQCMKCHRARVKHQNEKCANCSSEHAHSSLPKSMFSDEIRDQLRDLDPRKVPTNFRVARRSMLKNYSKYGYLTPNQVNYARRIIDETLHPEDYK